MSTTRTCQIAAFRFAFALLLLLAPMPLPAQETPEATTPPAEASNSADPLRAYLELQGQIHSAQVRTEQIVRDSVQAAALESDARNTQLLEQQFRDLEQRLAKQRTDEARMNLYVLSGFAALGFLAIVITAYFQWRAVSRIADFTAKLPEQLRVAALNAPVPVSVRNALLNSEQVDLANSRLLGAVERLEQRILELEKTAAPSLPVSTSRNGNSNDSVAVETAPPAPELQTRAAAALSSEVNEAGLSISELLDRSQTLLSEDRPDEALSTLECLLAREPQHADAWVKKGATFERLRKMNEAIECYDRAIAIDDSLTIAYLHKGAIFNRMERFGEAVECYEKALRTQEKRHAA